MSDARSTATPQAAPPLIGTSARGATELRAVPAVESGGGMLVRCGRTTPAVAVVRRQRTEGFGGHLAVDAGSWSREIATSQRPLDLPDDGLFPLSLDAWCDGVVGAGADCVLTPSRFVPLDDWECLDAVVRSGGETDHPLARTLVATDAAMLESGRLARLQDRLSATHRPLTLIFAAARTPMARRERLAALRSVVTHVPGVMVACVDALVASDVLAHGGRASCGATYSLRHPRRPWDTGGPPLSAGFVPGTFLRSLWETRSPRKYAQWFVDEPCPTCATCGGRGLDSFTTSPGDKAAILRHNAHSWIDVQAEVARRDPDEARGWLAADRRHGLDAHVSLRPVGAALDADATLRHLCELDDPLGRRTTPSGAWV